MEYKTSIDWYSCMQEDEIMLEKYTDPKGFFHNTTGPLKVGEIRLVYDPSKGWFEDLLTEEYRVYYMGLVCTDKGMLSVTYRGEAPFVSIGDKRHNIPVEERIKFLYEAFANANYNYLAILHRDPDLRGHKLSLFEITKRVGVFDDDIATFNINDL